MNKGENMPQCLQSFIGVENCNNPTLAQALKQAYKDKAQHLAKYNSLP